MDAFVKISRQEFDRAFEDLWTCVEDLQEMQVHHRLTEDLVEAYLRAKLVLLKLSESYRLDPSRISLGITGWNNRAEWHWSSISTYMFISVTEWGHVRDRVHLDGKLVRSTRPEDRPDGLALCRIIIPETNTQGVEKLKADGWLRHSSRQPFPGADAGPELGAYCYILDLKASFDLNRLVEIYDSGQAPSLADGAEYPDLAPSLGTMRSPTRD